jgi:hypothetical protein
MATGKIIVERVAALADTVTFEGGAKATLAAAHRRVLEILHRAGRPVYAELGVDGHIVRLLVPAIVKVMQLTPLPDGDLEILLEPSAARHWLRHTAPNFAALREALAALHASGAQALVSETDAREVVDVRPFAGRTERHARAKAAPAELVKDVTLAQAKELFDMVVGITCDPLDAEAPCIPFLYPDDGCFARAHDMCGRFVAKGVEPAKIWTWGYNIIPTVNNPACKVGWIYHVAPTLSVAGALYAIDPSLCDAPVTVEGWLAAMANPKVTLDYTPWTYYMQDGRPDPDFSDTERELAGYRAQLMLRSAEQGPPPYAHCQVTLV